jgi:hypothetical protein
LPDIVLAMDTMIPAGKELLKCQYRQLPSDRGVMAVGSVESHYTPGSHHLITYRTDLTSIPAGSTAPFDCYSSAQLVGHGRGSYFEAQQPDSRRDLPPGIAHEFQPGEVVMFESHYVNTTTEDLDAHVEVRLHTVELAKVEHEAGTIEFNDMNINVPAHGKARVTMTCPIPEDFNPALLWSHMHARGVAFKATTDDTAAAAALGTLYEQDDWEEPQPREYPSDPPVTIHAGSHITFSCEYQNDTDKAFMFGTSAVTNEMCLLHGMYWPRMHTAGAETCRGGTTKVERL